MAEKEYILKRVKDTILSIYADSEILLYGSRARGSASQDSDWDFLVLTELELEYSAKRNIRNAIHALELETGEVISIIIHSKDYWCRPQNAVTPFYQNVGRESIVI